MMSAPMIVTAISVPAEPRIHHPSAVVPPAKPRAPVQGRETWPGLTRCGYGRHSRWSTGRVQALLERVPRQFHPARRLVTPIRARGRTSPTAVVLPIPTVAPVTRAPGPSCRPSGAFQAQPLPRQPVAAACLSIGYASTTVGTSAAGRRDSRAGANTATRITAAARSRVLDAHCASAWSASGVGNTVIHMFWKVWNNITQAGLAVH
jgi:hypothetical protein